MKLVKSIVILMMIGSFSYAADSSEQTEAVAISNRHQAGIVKNPNATDSDRFGGYSTNRRGDAERARQIFNEIQGITPTKSGNDRTTD